jgi:Tfp pilus assembly pilus retraction ATPase PilT
MQLSAIIKGIISQRLLPRADGKGRVPAVEVLISTSRMRECIADEKRAREIRDAAAESRNYGMQTFDQSLMQYTKANGDMKPPGATNLTTLPLRTKYQRYSENGRRMPEKSEIVTAESCLWT